MAKRVTRTTDPRIQRSKRLVLEAALDQLAAVGYGAFTIESVAQRSGIAKSTIYRYWDGKLPLIAEAFELLNLQPPMPAGTEETRSARAGVEELLLHLTAVMQDSPFSACIPALIDAAERDRQVRKFHHRYSTSRMAALVGVLAAGVRTGELRADLDPELAALALVGPIFYRRLMTSEPFDPKRTSALVRTVLGPVRGR
jgi:TetR/AcrR family transcriptional regulator, regulator of autoinduction and epiphytic fitness